MLGLIQCWHAEILHNRTNRPCRGFLQHVLRESHDLIRTNLRQRRTVKPYFTSTAEIRLFPVFPQTAATKGCCVFVGFCFVVCVWQITKCRHLPQVSHTLHARWVFCFVLFRFCWLWRPHQISPWTTCWMCQLKTAIYEYLDHFGETLYSVSSCFKLIFLYLCVVRPQTWYIRKLTPDVHRIPDIPMSWWWHQLFKKNLLSSLFSSLLACWKLFLCLCLVKKIFLPYSSLDLFIIRQDNYFLFSYFNISLHFFRSRKYCAIQMGADHEFLPLCDVLFNIISLAGYFCDVVFDLVMSYALFCQGEIQWFAFSLSFILVSLLASQVSQFFSYFSLSHSSLVLCTNSWFYLYPRLSQ